MKLLVGQDIGSYSFTASTKTIVISGVTGFTSKERLLLITNVTTGTILYLFNDNTLVPASWTYNSSAAPVTTTIVLNAAVDTTGMADTDKLQIFIAPTKLLNPAYFAQRGHMFNVDTRHGYKNINQYPAHVAGFDDFCLIKNYPSGTVAAGNNNTYPNGYNAAWDSTLSIASPNNHGVYVAPKVGRTFFIERINLVVEVANQVDISKLIDTGDATLQLVHTGNVFCEARSLADLIVMAEDVKQLDSVFTSHFSTYIIPIVCKPAGAFNGTSGEYFHLRSSSGSHFVNDFITHLYASFTMWEVSL